jgi:hypothetical protein
MSAQEILKELLKLKPEERRAIASRVFELEQTDELTWATEAADLAFQELDRMENNDASSKGRWMVDLGLAAKARPCLLPGWPTQAEFDALKSKLRERIGL